MRHSRNCKKIVRGRPCETAHYGYGHHQGVELFVRKTAPLGDPIEIRVRGYELSLRKADAERIEVE